MKNLHYVIFTSYFLSIWAVLSFVFHWVVDVLLLTVLNVLRKWWARKQIFLHRDNKSVVYCISFYNGDIKHTNSQHILKCASFTIISPQTCNNIISMLLFFCFVFLFFQNLLVLEKINMKSPPNLTFVRNKMMYHFIGWRYWKASFLITSLCANDGMVTK